MKRDPQSFKRAKSYNFKTPSASARNSVAAIPSRRFASITAQKMTLHGISK